MWDQIAALGIIAALVVIGISHRNYKKKKKKKAFEAEMVRVAAAKIVRSHHKKAQTKGQTR